MSRHVATAQANGWLVVQRSVESRRENNVALTAAGRRLVERGRRHRTDAEETATAALGKREMERATQTLAHLAELLEQRLVE